MEIEVAIVIDYLWIIIRVRLCLFLRQPTDNLELFNVLASQAILSRESCDDACYGNSSTILARLARRTHRTLNVSSRTLRDIAPNLGEYNVFGGVVEAGRVEGIRRVGALPLYRAA